MASSHDKKDPELNQTEMNYSSSSSNQDPSPPSYQEISTLQGKSLDFDHGEFPWRDVTIRNPTSGTTTYFADVSVWSRHAPDITLRASGREGPLVAQASFSSAGRAIRCGLGADEAAMEWIEMKRAGMLTVNTYRFHHGGKTYTVSRTRDAEGGVTGIKRMVSRHYKVVDEASGRAVAYYISDFKPGTRKGTLTFDGGVEAGLEVLIVLAVVSLREKSRRRMARNAAVAGGSS